MGTNLLTLAEISMCNKQFSNGIRWYTQSNCSVTLTDSGYRIYRPPNVNPTDNGNTMWGGFVLRNISNGSLHVYDTSLDNIWGFKTGHTYILSFHISGKSSNAPEFYWTNQCGWGGGGLSPSPSNITYQMPGANFQGEFDAWYKWTINDSIVKTCTTSYSYATAGYDYLSYTDFKYGFGYTDTGVLGTDLYITNLRMFDITNEDVALKVSKNTVKSNYLYETSTANSSFKLDQSIVGNIIEY